MRPELLEAIFAELKSEETLVWAEQPNAKKWALHGVPLKLLATVPSVAFLLFWTYQALGQQIPATADAVLNHDFAWFGISSLLITAWGLLEPLRRYMAALRTVYVVTSWRVMAFHFARRRVVKTYGPRALSIITCTENSDGTGDLVFLNPLKDLLPTKQLNASEPKILEGFFDIPNVRVVQGHVLAVRG